MRGLGIGLMSAVFTRFHALCLLLFPPGFRARHGGPMRDAFRDTLDDAGRRGSVALVASAWAECLDAARQGLAHRRASASRGGALSVLDGLALDLRVARRSLAQRHSLTVVVALAVGIGATTAVFSVVDTVLIRQLPYPDADRLVRVGSVRPRSTSIGALSPTLFEALGERVGSFDATAASSGSWVTLTGAGRPQRIRAAWVSGDFFALLGATVDGGRLLGSADDRPEAPPAVVLSHDLWRRRHDRSNGQEGPRIGATIVLDGRSYAVVGVLPADFVPPEGNHLRGAFDVWLPLTHFDLMAEPGLVFLDAFARLAPDATLERLAGEVDALGRALAAELELPERAFTTLQTAPLRAETIGGIGQTLWALMGAVALLLVIACANVASLMLTRAAERQHEVGLRAALGAGGGRLARLLLLESTLLALVSSSIGAALAYLAVAALKAFDPADIPRLAEVGVDARVLGFALLMAIVAGLVTGFLPALGARLADPARALDVGSLTASTGRRRGTLARSMVVIQTALALILVIGAGLLMQSFVRLARVELGFDADGLVRMQVDLGGVLDGSDDAQRERATFFGELRRRVADIPGVRAAHLTTGAPFSPGGWYSSVAVIGRGEGEIGGPSSEDSAYRHQVSGGHLSALGLRVLEGREINDEDVADSLPVVVVNETLARHYWPDGNAVGAQVTIGGDGTFTPRTVVGVVSDALYHQLDSEPSMHIYLPFRQFPAFAMDVMVHVDGQPTAAIAGAMREAVWSLRPELPIRDVSGMHELVYADLVEPGFYTWLLASFATVALLLAGIGIYGSMAHATTLRTREIGIRVAIGAQPAETVRLVLAGGIWMTAVGMALGLAGAWATTRYLRGFLYGIEATDALAYAAASVTFLFLALLAAYVPARRAARVDPVIAMRSE